MKRPTNQKSLDFILDFISTCYSVLCKQKNDIAFRFANRHRTVFITLAIIILGSTTEVFAQLPVPFTPRLDGGSIKVKGDIVFIGNSIVTGAGLPQPYNGNAINNNQEGVYINVESGGDPDIFSSSSAQLVTDNSCKRILYAGLYWASVYPLEEANNPSVQFQGTPRLEDWNEIKFRLPTGGYIDLVADNDADPVGEEDDIIFDGYEYYGPGVENSFKDSPIICYKNVTNLLQGLTEADGEYAVANLRATRGRRLGGCSAGWTLVVIYESPILPSKYITLFDGYAGVQGGAELDIPVSGYQTLPAPYPVNANIGVAALEGDIGITGDSFQYKASTNPNFTVISDAINQANNFFNSSITRNGVHNIDRNPPSLNTLGMDINNVDIPNPGNVVIPNDATAGDLKLTTNGDGYGAFAASFSVEIIEPDIVLTKIVEDEFGNNIGGQVVDLGQELTYVIGFQNTGNDDAINFTIRDVLPINTILDYPTGLTLPSGVTVQSYDPVTRELVFEIDDSLVEEFDPAYEIRIQVTVVESCQQLVDVCSDLIQNQAFATYSSETNPSFIITDDPSYSNNTGCLLSPQTTNFLADLDDCIFQETVTLCGNTVDITAADGYDSYIWSTSPTFTPVIGTTQTITVDASGTYYVRNIAAAPCQSIDQIFEVQLFGNNITNPVIPYADEVVTCPNDGKLLPNIFLCGANDFRFIQTNISDSSSIIWEQLDESSCPDVADPDCANEDATCTWNQVQTGPDFLADTAGQYRITINYEGGCFVQFYFNVYENLLEPTVTSTDIICTTPGSITVNNVPSGYEYSLDNINFQTSNVFSVNTPGFYTVYIRQIGVDTNPCVFTVPDVQIRARDFNVTSTIVQPFCNGGFGNIQLAANDADPQYFFTLTSGGNPVNSVGPTMDNNYTFENLNPGTYTATVETEDGCLYTEDITIVEPPLLTVTAAVTSPLNCTDGEITIYPEGGTPPYFYFVNSTVDFQTVPEFTITAPGTYNILVIDSNNCEATTTVEVGTIPEPDFTINTADILCGNAGDTGSISINVTNPNGNSLAYSIDGGTTFVASSVFTGLSAGDYDVVIEYTSGASVCNTLVQSVTIIATPEITGLAELSAPFSCTSTGTISVTGVTGGTPPYQYSLDGVNFQPSNTFNGLSDGTYSVTILDASNCFFATNEIIINPLNPITDMDFSSTAVTCPNNTANITITNVIGGTGNLEYQIIAPTSLATPYQASNVFNNLSPNTYTFQVRDENDCVYSESYTISPIPNPAVNVVLTEGLDCTATPDAIFTGNLSGTPPFTYAVSFNGGAFTDLGSTATTFTYNTSQEGTYQFEITDGNGCTAISSEILVNPVEPPIIQSIASAQDILCHGDATGALDISIDNSSGTPPFTVNVFNSTTSTDYGTQTGGLPAGDYLITVTDANACTASQAISIAEPNPIVLNYSTVDITCTASGVSQGSIIVDSVTGGTAPYNYFVTGTNGYANSEFNATGTTSVSFDVVDFGLYQINIVDANGCSVLQQDVLVASPPTDLDINIATSVDCTMGGQAVVSVGSSLSSTGPFFFSIYQGPISVYPNPPGSWIPEDTAGSQSATFYGLTPGVSYTFIVFDQSTNCSYYEPATAPIPTNSTLSVTALASNNISCTGSADGNVSFDINSIYGSSVNISYEVFDSLSQVSSGISGTGSVPANGTLSISNLGPLPFGNYYVLISETSGPNAGCGVVSVPFNITESQFPLDLTVLINNNANCNPNSGQISAVAQNGTPPYLYQVTTTATVPTETDPNWASNSVFNLDGGNYYVHTIDAYGCIVTELVALPEDPSPTISAVVTDPCTITDGNYSIDVTLDTPGIAPYSYSINGGAFQTISAPFSIDNLFSGNHTVEIQDANGCGNAISIDILPPLDIIPTLVTEASCNNDDGVISINTSGGSGDFAYSIIPTAPSISIVSNSISGIPSGNYTITVLDNITGCSEDVTVVIPEAIAPTLSVSPTILSCFGDNSGTFDLTISDYSGNYTYEVFNNSGVSVTGLVNANTSTNPVSIAGLEAGLYDVVVTQTDAPFCDVSTDVIIVSPPEPLTISASETSNVTCSNSEGTITAIANGGWGSYEYELTGNITIPYSSNNVFEGLSAGNYTLNLRDAEGCIASTSITLEEPLPIDALFNPSTTVLDCFGDQNASITVTNVTGGQGLNYTYTLNTVSPVVSSSGPQTSNIFNNLGQGTYNITITDGFGCSFTSLDIVINEPSPIESNLIASSNPSCTVQASLTLSTTGGTGPYTYASDSSFSTILGTFANSTSFDVGPGTYSYYVRDNNGCITTVSNEITVEEIPDLIINLDSVNPTINCAGDNTGSIIASAQGGLGSYVYTLQDGLGNTLTAAQNSPGIFTELTVGDYIVVVESADCTTTSSPISITEPSAPLDASIAISDVTCTGTEDGFAEITASGGTGIIKYAISPQLNQFFESNLFENLAPGDYQAIAQDELGCFITFDFTITEPEPVILSIVQNSIFPELCDGDANGEFSIDISGGNMPYSVSLDNYDGPYTTGNTTQTEFDFTNLPGGDHIVYIRDAEGCESQWNITFPESVSINPLLELEYTCENNSQGNIVTVIIDDTTMDVSELDYALDGGPFQVSNVFNNVAVGTDHYIEVRHSNGCIQTTELFDIEPYIPLSLTLTEDGLNTFTASTTGGYGDYTYALNGEDYGDENTFIIAESGLYEVLVTDSSGCTAIATIEMEFIEICIPNWFTPNGDGQYDTWAPGCTENYPNLTFDIFDRYGRMVATYRVGQVWDGRYNGTELPTGDYWFVVKTNDSNIDKEFVGHFTLYR
ncbi:T9SS type B sorting domain-containing protein [Winogradskyella sp. DF17]|uniref:T9SS type B sorting domain-containing protein n=1 Tax=Winogradskyella pelagia TaxID=2819984 RepID=A0ABS3T7C3_9FLAO|nr:T9SS type B sorting domain-containing protein [Winogradskyella sp. DF17]MBO3117806.1 T9SS type B sorting domain-containing protein [Winogradskyella sp. DF17]